MRRGVWLFIVIGLLILTSSIISVSAENSPIKVMTYNVRFGCGSEENCANFNEVVSNLVSVIRSQDPDIFVIQEGNNLVWEKGGWTKPQDFRDPFTGLKEAFGNDYNIDGGVYANQPYNKQAIFVKKSRGSIGQVTTKTYPTGGRIYERAVVKIDGQQLIVYNTHLFPPPLLQSVHQDKKCVPLVRTDGTIEAQDFSQTDAQAKELAALVLKENQPVIVMGDLNVESDHLDGLNTFSEVNLNGVNTYPVKEYCARTSQYGFMNWHQQLDHIYYKGFTSQSGTVFQGDKTNIASDHYPVVASLTLDASNIKTDLCGNKKIVIIGASNSVKNGNSFGELIQNTCPHSQVFINARGSTSPVIQLKDLFPTAMSQSPDVLIIEPSANGITELLSYKNAVITMVQEAKSRNANIKVAVTTISPHKNYDYGSGYKWTQNFQNNVDLFNNDLLTNTISWIDIPVDIYSVLSSSSDKDICGFCNSDGGHWNSKGQTLVAQKIMKEVFNYNGPLSTGASSTVGQSSSGVTPIVGQQTGATIQIDQGCAINQRCKDIDTAWNVFGGVLGLRAGQVWVPSKSTWMTFNDAYGGKQMITQTVPTNGGSKSGGTSGSGIVECATEDTSLTIEERAFLDAIAYAEDTTRCGIKHGVPSYKIKVGCTVFDSYSKHPAESVQTQFGKSFAAGRYQNLHVSTFNGPKAKYPDFTPASQDRAALDLTLAEGGIKKSDLGQNTNWEVIWNAAARTWASIVYTDPLTQKELDAFPACKDKLTCGNGHSFFGQGEVNHATLTKAYNICLKYYQENPQNKGGQFKLSDEKPLTPAPLTGTPEICDNYIDDNNDGKVDCEDLTCEGQPKGDNVCHEGKEVPANSEKRCESYDIDLGDGYFHKCTTRTTAQACVRSTGEELPEYLIANVKDQSQRNILDKQCAPSNE